jgi:hypothetical protein
MLCIVSVMIVMIIGADIKMHDKFKIMSTFKYHAS